MKHYFIINPAAGANKKHLPVVIEHIEKACKERNVSYEIYKTKSAKDGTDFVKGKCEEMAALCESDREILRFYACGGDGTNNEVVSGVIGYDFAQVGFFPDGTGNDFIRCFTNTENFTDISALLDARTEKIDIISCNDKYVLNIMNIGFDCSVVYRAGKLKRYPLMSSSMAYICGVVVELVKKPGTKLKVSVDGGEFQEKSLLLSTFSNGRFCGGGFRSSSKARLQNGFFDICFIKNVSRTKFIKLVSKYRSGEYLDVDKYKEIVDFVRCKEALLKFDEPTNVCIDGEIFKTTEVSLKLREKALTILIPKGSDFAENEKELIYPVFATPTT